MFGREDRGEKEGLGEWKQQVRAAFRHLKDCTVKG